MKLRLLLPTVAVLAAACVAPAHAALPTKLIGEPAPLSSATRTIWINPGTRWVNVQGGETVKFVVGNSAFAWDFNGATNAGSFDLNQIAPRGALRRPLRAYLAPDPLYLD
ncbi:MAG TPA: hypothetical protein DCW29_08555 [Janthinobacterium sp.]|nr:hypothetical protein [Janthinobacterium sp.]